MVLPCQSYMAQVSGSVSHSSDDVNLEKFSLLSASFGWTAFSPTFDPWDYVDSFGRPKIYKYLQSSYRVVLSRPKKSSIRSETDDSVVDESALKPPTDTKSRRLERSASRSATSSVVADPVTGSSIS